MDIRALTLRKCSERVVIPFVPVSFPSTNRRYRCRMLEEVD
jgi:hypothetical protein